ncbi:uncharacterized protein LOC142586844 [Dermacentor variabilis]|uniref:uncharacterized protein LOC142586844 n=1 Tax=Dermacentor variabilis TaxID=34621 RepID=UPI003F5C139E
MHRRTILFLTVLMATGTPGLGKQNKQWFVNRECEEPIMESETHCGSLRVHRYFFNRTSRKCEAFHWNGCMYDGVYDMRVKCAVNCHMEEEAGVCAQPQEASEGKSGVPPIDRFSYDLSKETCTKYQIYKTLGQELTANAFPSSTLCAMHCGGFTWRDTEQGKNQKEERKLLQLLDTSGRIWIYLSTSQTTRDGKVVTCDNYKPFNLRPIKHNTYEEYDVELFYEFIVEDKTYQEACSGKIKKENEKEVMELIDSAGNNNVRKVLEHWDNDNKCGIFSLTSNGQTEYELHVWEKNLRAEYESTNTYTGCHEALNRFCNKNRVERFQQRCENIVLINRSANRV